MKEIEGLKRILRNHEKRISKLEAKSKVQSASSSQLVKRRKSIMDLIIELKNDGFFKKPKFANEIIDKLGCNGPSLRATKFNRTLTKGRKKTNTRKSSER